MNVPCPRGQNCPGSTAFVVQKCFLSETTSRMPRFVRRQMKKEISGFLPRVLYGFAFAKAESDGLVEYRTYQCAACGARVFFMKFQGKLDRLGDDLEEYG